VLVLAIALFGSEPGAAQASVRALGTARSAAIADGARWWAYQPDLRTVRVVDDASERRATIALPVDAALIAGGRGYFVLAPTSDTSLPPYVLVARSGQVMPVAGVRDIVHFAPFAIGRYWVAGVGGPIEAQTFIYFNWRTGEKQDFDEGVDAGFREPRDLNSSGLDSIAPSARSDLTFLLDGGLLLTEGGGRNIHQSPNYLLLKDDDKPARRIARCASTCNAISLGGGAVTWTDSGLASLYDIHSGHTTRWRWPRGLDGENAVAHTRRRVLFSVPRGDPGSFRTTFRLYSERR
jgi:hypothetical protein